MTFLKQFAVACTPEGEIGIGQDLLFTSAADLLRFRHFTKGTVLIVGRKTAQQMINAGVSLGERRMIVITQSGLVDNMKKESDSLASYAYSLSEAISQAEKMVKDEFMLGWTIIGGKTVYEALFEQMDNGYIRINRAYIFTAEIPNWLKLPNIVKLNRDISQIVTLTSARMQEESVVCSVADSTMKATRPGGVSPSSFRGKGQTYYITDKKELDFEPISYNKGNGLMKVKNGGAVEAFYACNVNRWSVRDDVQAVDLFFNDGDQVTVRPGGIPAVNALILALKSL